MSEQILNSTVRLYTTLKKQTTQNTAKQN